VYIYVVTHIFHHLECLEEFMTKELADELSKKTKVDLHVLVQRVDDDVTRL